MRCPVTSHCNPPAKSTPIMYFAFCFLQCRTVPLPPNAKQSALKQTLVLVGIGSENGSAVDSSKDTNATSPAMITSPIEGSNCVRPISLNV